MSNTLTQGPESIHNEQGLVNVPLYTNGSIEGQAAAGCKIRNRTNPRIPQIETFTVGGTATDGVYSIAVIDETGATLATISHERSGAETSAAVAGFLRTNLVSSSALKGKIVSTSTGSGSDVVFTSAHPRKSYTFVLTAPAPGTLAQTATQVPGGIRVSFGRFLIEGADPQAKQARLPLTSSTAAQLRGVTRRAHSKASNTGRVGPVDESYDVASNMELVFEGAITVKNRGGVAGNPGDSVHVVVNTAGGDELGTVRADQDGANTVDMGDLARWDEYAPVNGLGRIYLRM